MSKELMTEVYKSWARGIFILRASVPTQEEYRKKVSQVFFVYEDSVGELEVDEPIVNWKEAYNTYRAHRMLQSTNDPKEPSYE